MLILSKLRKIMSDQLIYLFDFLKIILTHASLIYSLNQVISLFNKSILLACPHLLVKFMFVELSLFFNILNFLHHFFCTLSDVLYKSIFLHSDHLHNGIVAVIYFIYMLFLLLSYFLFCCVEEITEIYKLILEFLVEFFQHFYHFLIKFFNISIWV